MKHILLDTNVVLDALLLTGSHGRRTRFRFWQAHVAGQIDAHAIATSLTNIFYVSRKLGASGLGKVFTPVSTNCGSSPSMPRCCRRRLRSVGAISRTIFRSPARQPPS